MWFTGWVELLLKYNISFSYHIYYNEGIFFICMCCMYVSIYCVHAIKITWPITNATLWLSKQSPGPLAYFNSNVKWYLINKYTRKIYAPCTLCVIRLPFPFLLLLFSCTFKPVRILRSLEEEQTRILREMKFNSPYATWNTHTSFQQKGIKCWVLHKCYFVYFY